MFIMFVFLFFRFLPSISEFEMRDLVWRLGTKQQAGRDDMMQGADALPAPGSAD